METRHPTTRTVLSANLRCHQAAPHIEPLEDAAWREELVALVDHVHDDRRPRTDTCHILSGGRQRAPNRWYCRGKKGEQRAAMVVAVVVPPPTYRSWGSARTEVDRATRRWAGRGGIAAQVRPRPSVSRINNVATGGAIWAVSASRMSGTAVTGVTPMTVPSRHLLPLLTCDPPCTSERRNGNRGLIARQTHPPVALAGHSIEYRRSTSRWGQPAQRGMSSGRK